MYEWLHPTIFCGMQLLIHYQDTCFWRSSPDIENTWVHWQWNTRSSYYQTYGGQDLQSPDSHGFLLCGAKTSMSSTRKHFNYLRHLSVEKWWNMQIYFYNHLTDFGATRFKILRHPFNIYWRCCNTWYLSETDHKLKSRKTSFVHKL